MAKSHYPSGYSFKDSKKKSSRFNTFLALLCIVLVFAVILSFFADQHWIADLFSHFSLQYFLGGLLLTFMLLLRGKRIFAVVAIVAALSQAGMLTKGWNFEGYADEELPDISHELVTDSLRIYQHNAFRHNRSKSQIVDEIIALRERDDVDLVVLQEITPEWTPFIERLKKKFLYSQIEAKEDSFGYAVFSRVPTVKIEKITLKSGYPLGIIRAYSRDQLIPFSVYMIHATTPLSDRGWKKRNETLEELAVLVDTDLKAQEEKGETQNVIVSGDLNVTPYSPWFQMFLEKSRLEYHPNSLSTLGTWPNYMPAPLRIPIDHTLASANIRFDSRTLGDNNGSDHMAVLTTFRIPSTKKKVEYREISDAPTPAPTVDPKEVETIEMKQPVGFVEPEDVPKLDVEQAPQRFDEPTSGRMRPRLNKRADTILYAPNAKIPELDVEEDDRSYTDVLVDEAFERAANKIAPKAGGNAAVNTYDQPRRRAYETTGSQAIDDAIKAGLLPPDVMQRGRIQVNRPTTYRSDWDDLTPRYGEAEATSPELKALERRINSNGQLDY